MGKKSQKLNRKTPNCHKTKMRKKEKKNHQNNVSHHILTHPIEAPLHTHTNSPKLHPLSIIHVIKSINQQNSQFSISTLLSSLYPNIRLQMLIYLPIKMNPD